jgi:short-subunit dehydrogenase
MNLKPLSEQILVITGASSGIGLLTARLAAKSGASVMLVARSGIKLHAIAAEIQGRGGTADFAIADVGDRAQIQAAAAKVLDRFGRIDTWVSNAGVAIYAALLETPIDEHERLFRTNYFGCVNSTQVAMGPLEASGGAFIAVSSIAGEMPSPVMGAYAASKHAVAAFVRSLRIEARDAKSGVSITLVKPSGMATPINRHAANHRAGLPKIPPPAYDPALVARAILHAAVVRTPEITVGGVGRAEVLFANHFPALFERIAPIVDPLLQDRSRAPSQVENLFDPTGGGERSTDELGRPYSLYGFVQRHSFLAKAFFSRR